MKIKKIVLYLFLLLLFGLAFYFLFFDANSTLKVKSKPLGIKQTELLTKICLIEKQDTLILEKNTDQWFINKSYRADNKQVRKLLEIFAHIELKPLALSMKEELIEELKNAVSIDVYKGEKVLLSFFLKKTGNGKIYLMSKDKKEPYEWDLLALDESPFSYISTQVSDWQSKKVVQFLAGEIISLAFKSNLEHSKSFLLEKEGEQFFLSKNKKKQKIDGQLARQFLIKFTKLTFQKYAFDISQSAKESIKKTVPIFTIEVTNNNHKSHCLKAFYKPILNQVDEFGNAINMDPHLFLLLLENNGFVYAKYYDFEFLNFHFL